MSDLDPDDVAADGPTDLDVRRFQSGDGERVRELNERAMRQTPEWLPDVPDEDLEDVPGNYLEREGADFLVAVLDGEVVGTGAYAPVDEWKAEHFGFGDETGEFTRVRVAPAHQGRGVGTAICEALERRARDDGYRALVLDTGPDNEPARGLYESLDYRLVDEVTVEFADVSVDLVVYRRSLSALGTDVD